MKPIKVAQIGMEHDHAVVTFNSLLKHPEWFEVVAYAQPNPNYEMSDWAKGLTKDIPCMTPEEILEIDGLEGVIIETIEHDLSKYALMAAKKGIPVHMDKPGGCSFPEFEELIAVAKAGKVPFHTGYMYRYNPAVKYAMDVVKSGALGEVYAVEAQMNCEHLKPKREWLGQYKGGMMFFLGCHLVDLIIQFMGAPESVLPMNCATGLDGVNSEDYGFAVFKYKNGLSFAKTCASEINGYARRQTVICGSKGTLEIKPMEVIIHGTGDQGVEMTEAYIRPDHTWSDAKNPVRFANYDRYDDMMHEFARIVRGEIQMPYTYDYELMVYKNVLLASGYTL